jgi:rubrerythrin
MSIFNAEDVIQFAIRIEENGEKYYQDAERTATDENPKRLFRRLAAEESEHKEFFKKLLLKTNFPSNPEDYQGEYLEELRAYIDEEAALQPSPKDKNDIASILAAAARREAHSILYYEGLKKFVSEDDSKVLDKIKEEEQRHFTEIRSLARTDA